MSESYKISAVIISYNEEEYIGDCIRSLQEVVDEIIVIDGYSTDQTKSICESLGVTLIENDWMGYSKTKNLGISAAKNPFILSLDADEVLSEELIRNIQKQKKIGLKLDHIYSFNRLNNYCGQWIKYAGWYPDRKKRLFSKNNTKWVGEVHETLAFKKNVKTVHIPGDILHYSIKDKEDHIARILKYNKLTKTHSNHLFTFLSACSTFIKLYIIKLGFLEGKLGFQLCLLSAKSKIWR